MVPNPELKALPKLIAKYRLPNTKKAIGQIITSFGPFLAILVLMYLTIYYQSISNRLLLPLTILNGFFLVRIFIIQHDCGHQSFFSSTRRNNIVGMICSFFSLIPYQYWAKSHSFHHNNNGKLRPYRDIGDIFTYSVGEFKKLSTWAKLKYKTFRNPFVMFGIGPARYILVINRLPLIDLPGRSKERLSLVINNIAIIVVYVILGIIFGRKALLYAHLPIIICFASIAIRFFYIQHQHELTYKSREKQRDYVTAAIQGSSYYDLPNWLHRFTGNIGYHHIHHLNASIPNYELARCFKEVQDMQRYANKLTIKQSLSALRCHLRDEYEQKMISFSEFRKKYR